MEASRMMQTKRRAKLIDQEKKSKRKLFLPRSCWFFHFCFTMLLFNKQEEASWWLKNHCRLGTHDRIMYSQRHSTGRRTCWELSPNMIFLFFLKDSGEFKKSSVCWWAFFPSCCIKSKRKTLRYSALVKLKWHCRSVASKCSLNNFPDSNIQISLPSI